MELVNPLTAYPIGRQFEDINGIGMKGITEKQGVAFSRHGYEAAKLDPTIRSDIYGAMIRRTLRPLSQTALTKARAEYAAREVPEMPPYLIIEPVGGICPRKCGFCSINVTHRPLADGRTARAGMMKWDGYMKLMREFGEWGGGYGVSIYELGETGLYRGKDENGNKKDWADLVDAAKRVGKFKIANISTSGDVDNLDRLLDCDLDDLIFSVDGLDKKTYEANRPSTIPNDTTSFERTTDRIMAFLEKKSARGLLRPFCRMQIINNSLCAPQVVDFIRYWIQIDGIDDILVKNLDGMGAWLKGVVPEEEAAIKMRQVASMPCQHIWEVASVTWTGAMNACSHDAYTDLFDGHTIYNSTFREWWQGGFMQDLRDEHNRGVVRKPCIDCAERDCWLG